MIPVGDPFPTMTFPSSKGGDIDLRDIFAQGPSIIGVVPRDDRPAWLEAAARHTSDWLLGKFLNVYLVLNVEPAEARRLCDEYGIQAPVLCDTDGILGPHAEGFYRVSAEGAVEKAVDKVTELDEINA